MAGDKRGHDYDGSQTMQIGITARKLIVAASWRSAELTRKRQ
jgi:hypothetical protein